MQRPPVGFVLHQTQLGGKWQWTAPGAERDSKRAALLKDNTCSRFTFMMEDVASNKTGKCYVPTDSQKKDSLASESQENMNIMLCCVKCDYDLEHIQSLDFYQKKKKKKLLWSATSWPRGAMKVFAEDVALTQCHPKSRTTSCSTQETRFSSADRDWSLYLTACRADFYHQL